ncbi:nuclear pore complex protein Nup153 [Bicyclus anynana]|uniref:Nuclear pore complex protein Nup153 n=1 Tax=Bicyclus anynana TaxID=110368 RepID=A0A6J1MSS8_BICAN|nr:nuclear pore complex protein Nup153 [Bicyclus anynana]
MSADPPPRKGRKHPRPENDANNSFVSNVKSKISRLLPSTITKWFSSPCSSDTYGSDSEDEGQYMPEEPPAKRMRYSTPSSPNKPETKTTGTNTEPIATISELNTTSTINSFRPSKVSTPVSSLVKEAIVEQVIDPAVHNLQNSSSSKSQNQNIQKRKSLFGTPVTDKPYYWDKQQCSPQLKKPALFSSPFYSGYTRYGGASSTYINQPNITHKKDALIGKNSGNETVDVSYATRRVMELLENYSSPIIEAKRISQFANTNDSLDKSLTNNAYKTQELYLPKYAEILQLKRRSKLTATTSAARQLIASHSSSQAIAPYPIRKKQSDNPPNLPTTIKPKIKTVDREVSTVAKNDNPAVVHLPTAVLQIDQNNLPKFTFGTSVSRENNTNGTTALKTASPAISTTTGNTVPTISTIDEESGHCNKTEVVREPESIINNNSFKFSSPVMINVQTEENSSLLPNFTFASPDGQIIGQEENTSLSITNNKLKPGEQAQTWKCNDCWVSNKAASDKCVCCNGARPLRADSIIKHQSTSEIALIGGHLETCTDCEKNSIHESRSKSQDCWIKWVVNDKGKDNSIFSVTTKSQEITPCVTSKAENVVSEWKCEVCWVKNKITADKCVACGGSKQTPAELMDEDNEKPNVPNIQASDTSTITNIMNLQNDQWECTVCLVRNDKNKDICVCCDSQRPGKIKENDGKQFKFSSAQNTTFKFGIEPTQNVLKPKEIIDTMSSPQLITPVKDAEKNNNLLPSFSSTFTFRAPKLMGASEEGTIVEDSPKQTFTFGVTKSIAPSTPIITNLLTISTEANTYSPNLIEIDEKDEKGPEGLNIEEPNVTQPQNTEKTGGLFGIPSNAHTVTTTASEVGIFGQEALNVNNRQAVPSTTTTAVDVKVCESTFSFSASTVKTGLQLFSAPTTTVSAILSTQTSSPISFFQKSEPVSMSSINFFSKTEPIPSSLQLFNKSEITTTVTASPLSSVPVFSFGASNQVTQAEKPKFNFTFGNKLEQPLFSLQTSNTGNHLPSNGLPSATTNTVTSGLSNTVTFGLSNTITSGLPAEKTVGGISLPSNSLSSGALVGTAKNGNPMWPTSYQLDAIKMTSENNLDQTVNNLPAIQSGNPFALQTKKDNNRWSLNQNSSNNNIGSLQLPMGNNLDAPNNSVGASSGGIFGALEKKENVWSLSNNNSNIFSPNTGSNNVQKSINFSFGPSMQMSSYNTPTPTFGTFAQPTQNIFDMSSQGNNNNNQPDMFSPGVQSQSTPNLFGNQAVNNNGNSVGMFGTLNTSGSMFGSVNPSISTFEAPPSNPVPTPTFNFGTQQVPGVFGFGQQQPQTQGGVYNFGAQTTSPAAPRRFNIGTAGTTLNTTGRRPMRRAVRRNFQQ